VSRVAGTVRIAVGVLLLLIGLLSLVLFLDAGVAADLILIWGVVPILIGVALIASGLRGRSTGQLEDSVLQQQRQVLLQQQIDHNMLVMQGRPFAPPEGAERYCPVCGGGNLRSDSFCQQCGKPLPAPP
jgi:hypothetical protein